MLSKLPYGLLLILIFSYTTPVLATSNPPLDFIELLGEMDDDDILEAALAEVEQIKPKKVSSTKQSSQQKVEATAPVGEHKK